MQAIDGHGDARGLIGKTTLVIRLTPPIARCNRNNCRRQNFPPNGRAETRQRLEDETPIRFGPCKGPGDGDRAAPETIGPDRARPRRTSASRAGKGRERYRPRYLAYHL